MTYVSPWESLSEALRRVMATGLAEDAAKRDICLAIFEGAVQIQVLLSRHTTKLLTAPGVQLHRDDIDIRDLSATDLDWEISCPLKPWAIRRRPHLSGGYWRIKQILLFKEAVSRVLCDRQAAPGRRPQPAANAGAETAAVPALAAHLGRNPQLTKAAAVDWIRSQGFSVSDRGFQYRVWPKARENAGLESKARAGRKRKSSR